jgi:hypothetical protein
MSLFARETNTENLNGMPVHFNMGDDLSSFMGQKQTPTLFKMRDEE